MNSPMTDMLLVSSQYTVNVFVLVQLVEPSITVPFVQYDFATDRHLEISEDPRGFPDQPVPKIVEHWQGWLWGAQFSDACHLRDFLGPVPNVDRIADWIECESE